MNANAIRKLIAQELHRSGLQKQAVARAAGISREMLYKFETGKSDLSFGCVADLLSVLGLRLEVVPDFEPLPKESRQEKTRRQGAYLARGEIESVTGIAHGAQLGKPVIPDLVADW